MNTDVEEQMLDLVKKVAGMRGAGQEGEGERGAIYTRYANNAYVGGCSKSVAALISHCENTFLILESGL